MNNTDALKTLDAAAADGKLSPKPVENIRTWLTAPYLAEYAPAVAEHLAAGKWKQLDDVFWTTIPFGTGGRRGAMYPIGTNAINDRTIGESAQGLANYVKAVVGNKPLGCAIAYDTRHRSRDFAQLCSEIMAAAGFKVWFLDGFRSTPECSFTVRYKHCDCGIMITASHNPPTDNAVKVYWSTGGQLLSPHDTNCIDEVYKVKEIQRLPWEQGLASGQIEYCQEEVDKAFIAAVLKQSVTGPRDLKIIYSPLHGVGASAVCPVLAGAGFRDVELFGPHSSPDPDFTNIPNHIANPENANVFDAIIDRAKQTGAELILATDPDCDRLGCATQVTTDKDSAWATLTGNQVGALLTDSLLAARKQAGTITSDLYVVKTLVTTDLIKHIADSYGVQTAGNLLVGFKYIGGEMDARGPQNFVFGAEESYGFLAGDHVRDKDAAVASLLVAELAARLKSEGRTLHEQLDALYAKYGVHSEGQVNVQMPGEQGMDMMKALMARFRASPPESLAGMKLTRVRDYLGGTVAFPGMFKGLGIPDAEKRFLSEVKAQYEKEALAGRPTPLDGPHGDMVILDLELEGNYVAVRPSGTEPKVKFYVFAYDPPTLTTNVATVKATQAARLKELGAALRTFSGV